MKSSRPVRRLATAAGALAVALALTTPANLAAQERGPMERHHPYLAELLDTFETAHGLIFREVVAAGDQSPGAVDARLYDRVVQEILAPGSGPPFPAADQGGSDGPPAAVSPPSSVLRALDRASAFHRNLLDVYADPRGTETYREVRELVDEYRAEPETAFLTDPKDMTLMTEGPQAGAFREAYPRIHGLVWAHRWLQLAAFEPLIRYEAPERRRAGMMAVVARFWSMLENPPESFPVEMPQTPTIAPALVARHPDAAAILDNANMFHDMVADHLVSDAVEDPSAVLRTTLARFQDPQYFWSSWYDWNRMAILHGVGNQGGWATGIIPDPKRTEVSREHMDHFSIPGMPVENE